MTIWRAHIKIVDSVGRSRIDLCLNKGVLAMGWSLNDGHLKKHNFNEDEKTKICKQRSAIKSYDDYEALIKEWKVYGGNVDDNVRRLYYNVKPDDLVWIRDKGIYYLGRVGENSQWLYDDSQELLDRDSTTQRTDIEWIKVGDESSVPGSVTIAFIRGKTLQRIASKEVETFSKHYYNTIMKNDHYQGLAIEPNKETLYSLLSPTDCEDLVCAYLSSEYKYIVVPSTNKKSTELYECVLLDPKDRSHVYIQVKKGKVDIDANDFRHLQGKVFLFTSEGTVQNLDSNKNIECISPKELFEFAMSDAAKNIVSDTIAYWTEYMRQELS